MSITIDYQRRHPYVEGSNKVPVQVHHVFLILISRNRENMETKIKKVKFSLQKQKTTLGRKLSTMSTAAVSQLRRNQSTDSFRRKAGPLPQHAINKAEHRSLVCYSIYPKSVWNTKTLDRPNLQCIRTTAERWKVRAEHVCKVSKGTPRLTAKILARIAILCKINVCRTCLWW